MAKISNSGRTYPPEVFDVTVNEGFLAKNLFAMLESRASTVTKNAKGFLHRVVTANQSLELTFKVFAHI